MNKRFLKIALLSAVCASMPVSFTSCKDYDDDITEINNNADGLSKQIAALQTALETAQATATAAQNAAQQALTAAAAAQDAADKAAKEAAAAAELAKSAAATAKAEAIQEVINQLKPLIDANTSANEANAKKIAELAGKIEGIEKGLSNIDLTEINKTIGDQADLIAANAAQIQAINTQLAALDQLKKDLAGLQGDVADLKAKIATIDAVKADLTALQATVQANMTEVMTAVNTNKAACEAAIAEVKAELTKLSAQISSEVSNAVNTIAGVLAQRLTSVTLMPSLYVDGIPTIEFLSAKYTKKVLKNGNWVPATGSNTQFIVTNNATEADYRLNPGTLKNEDIAINDLAFVTRIATSRAGEKLDEVINVASANVNDNGVLNVKLGKSNTSSLNLTGNQIYTVSLKVPVASKHLFEGEANTAVYSEFTRLAETYFQPELKFVDGAYNSADVNSHLNDSTALYASATGAMVAKNLVYNESYDLYKLVEGCAMFSATNHKNLTREALQAYGMDIKFRKATAVYAPTEDKTNQQAYVKLEGDNGSTLVPVTSSGQEDNQTIIGRQPIIAATLVDVVNGNVIEQKYFKVLFTAEKMEDVTIEWPQIDVTGAPCTGAYYNFGWKEMAERVLEHLNGGKGMSKEDFTKIYGNSTPVIAPANDNNGTLTPNIVASNLDASTPVMTWSVTADQLGVLRVGANTANFTKTITFNDPTGLHANVVIKLKWAVTTTVGATTLGRTDDLKWANNTMKVYPVPMAIPYDGTQKAEYKTNILEGRYKPYTTGMLSCGQYDIDYQKNQTGYIGEALELQNGYSHWNFTEANQANLDEIYYTIAHTDAGKALVSAGRTVKIDWTSNINGLSKNNYVFGTINLQIVKILKLNTLAAGSFTDNSREQTLNIAKAYSLTDAYGNLVAAEPTADEPYAADYYSYYGVESAEFGNDIKVADNAEGTVNVRTLAALNMTANVDNATGVLTFQNNGAPLQGNAYLIVPVTVKHYWGTLTGTIAVPLNKSNAPLNANRK